MGIFQRLHRRLLSKDEFGDEIAHHIRDLGMPRDQAVAVAYAEEGEGKKMAKDVTVATGLTHHDQMGTKHKLQDVSEMVKRAVKRR